MSFPHEEGSPILELGFGKPHLTHSAVTAAAPPDPHAHRSSYEERLGSLPTPCFGSTEVIGNSCSHHEGNILPAIKETFTSKHTSDIPHKVNRHCVPPLQPEGHINATGGSLRSSTKYRK